MFTEWVIVVDGFFFFQAEDGIRDVAVTGVQTCALPISSRGNWEISCLPRATGALGSIGKCKLSLEEQTNSFDCVITNGTMRALLNPRAHGRPCVHRKVLQLLKL